MDERSTQTRPRATTRPVPIGELLDAWLALQRGDFHRGGSPRSEPNPATRPGHAWRTVPGEVPVLIIGCVRSAGASTVALLLAGALHGSRVVDCAPTSFSGLAGAATAELGEAKDGWLAGRRDTTVIQRRGDNPSSAEVVPLPPPGEPGRLSIVDAWWEPRQLLTSDGWLSDLARTCPRVVLVARGSVPGMGRLEATVSQFGCDRCWAVVSGMPRRWPSPLQRSLGTRTLQLSRAGRLFTLPENHALAMSGLTTEPLPRAFEGTARQLAKGLLP